MMELTGKKVWQWGKEQDQAFQEIKGQIASAPVLAIPTDNGPYQVECDASEGALGAVLSQQQNGVWKPIAFISKALSDTERNYKIYDKELLTIMKALEEWRQYLMGKEEFTIYTDHQNLTYFGKPQKLTNDQPDG